eukprot:TRINITY_DN27853_c0_g1_i1.p1 TRINITY_DN27853_c0_g1~~TRINITY_DN27853_c0_g1_i1.p1  ORF type:complete len:699 (+),score=283.54 TRINITY_DN27853_c0_g1_i1:60-2156(+)
MGEPAPTPPVARVEPKALTTHEHTRTDNYYWMRLSDAQKEAEAKDAHTEEVLAYLNAENAYQKAVLNGTESLQESVYQEIVGRIKQQDESVPVKKRGYIYYVRFEEGEDYALRCRKKDEPGATEEILVNGPELGKGKKFYKLGGATVSTDNTLLAYSTDFVSRRQYTIHVKDLSTGRVLQDEIPNTTGGATWANDNRTLYYTRRDEKTLRACKVYKHVLGTDVAEDELVFEEADETYHVGLWKSKSERFMIINSSQTLADEYRLLDLEAADPEWRVFCPRRRDHEHSVQHHGEHFYITTNKDGAKNFKLMRAKVDGDCGEAGWEEVIPHRDDVLLEGVVMFEKFMVIMERKNGLEHLRIREQATGEEHDLAFPDPCYSAGPKDNEDFNTDVLRFSYTSLVVPNSTFDYNMATREQELLKQTEVLGGFAPEEYTSERFFVKVRDGASVPVSLVYRRDTPRSGATPLFLTGYGSYGSSYDAYFSSSRLSLLNRGFVYAIAHIRGGEEMGRHWYEQGKLLHKKNTFYDFIDVAEALIERGYTSTEHLYASGGSAGGLLMGAVANMRPDLWRGVLSAVPFVDVVTTMLDETIPLTTFEWDEWGNPAEKPFYDYMLSYSPYDQIAAQAYPHMLVTTGYWDSQVQYWEPAKYVAKLRATKTDDRLLLMECNLEHGHGGASGRFRQYRELALEFCFMFHLEGIAK